MMTSISLENHHHVEGRMSPLVGLLLLLSAKYKEASSTSDTAAYYTNNNNTEDCLAHLPARETDLRPSSSSAAAL